MMFVGMTFVGVEMMWRESQLMPLSLAKEIFMKWTTWMIVSSLMMSPTMKMTTQSSTAMMSSVIGYCCCMRNYVIVIIEIGLDAKMVRKCQLGMVYVGQGLSNSRQRVEAVDQEAHHSDEARPVGSEDETQPQRSISVHFSPFSICGPLWSVWSIHFPWVQFGLLYPLQYPSVHFDDYIQTPAPVQNLAPENRRARRGRTKLADIWEMTGDDYKIPLPLNAEGQPIDRAGSLFKRWLGSFCENGLLCPLTPAGWPSVAEKYKRDCWVEIEKRYIINPTIVAWAMHQLWEIRRNRRTKLKKKVKKRGMTREQVLATIPDDVMKVQWREMVEYWFNEKTEAKAKGAPVERADVYQQVYRTKDGVAISSRVQENMGMRLEGEIGSGILWSRDDAYARVMDRPERPGRVRGVGFGITPSGRSATNNSLFTSSPSSSTRTTQRISGLETSHEELREQLTQLQARHREELAQSDARHKEDLTQSEARHREELAQSEARHKQQLDELRNSMREMFDKFNSLGPVIHELYPSQVANKCCLTKLYFLQCIVM
ncbi:hypothetical protein ACB092_04G120600 [Castanea dentata]